jgi:hypothetical protein
MTQGNEVATAFDIVLEEIENAIEGLNQDGAKAFQTANYEMARELMDKGSQMTAFRERVSELQKEWNNIFPAMAIRKRRRKRSRKAKRRLKRGLRTREEAFRAPILQALVQLGGQAPVSEILDKVSELVADKLNEYDRSPLPSNASMERWRNTAQWARLSMVREGLLASDSPRGMWAISAAGRKRLKTEAQQESLFRNEEVAI